MKKGEHMSGRFVPTIRFPVFVEGCKCGRLQIEPILCTGGYGINIKILLTLTANAGADAYEYDRIIDNIILTQESLPESNFTEQACDFFEGLYFNKIPQDVAVPIAALTLKTYLSDMLDQFGIDLSDYFTDIDQSKSTMGYKT